jgi:hypothetical protein
LKALGKISPPGKKSADGSKTFAGPPLSISGRDAENKKLFIVFLIILLPADCYRK